MEITKKQGLSENNKDLFDYLSHLQFQLESDKEMLQQNIESPRASMLRKFQSNPDQAIVDLFNDSNAILEDLLLKSTIDLIQKTEFVKEGKYSKNNSAFSFFLLLEEDNIENRDVFYDKAYLLLNSPLSDKFRLQFHFIDEDLLQRVEGTSIERT